MVGPSWYFKASLPTKERTTKMSGRAFHTYRDSQAKPAPEETHFCVPAIHIVLDTRTSLASLVLLWVSFQFWTWELTYYLWFLIMMSFHPNTFSLSLRFLQLTSKNMSIIFDPVLKLVIRQRCFIRINYFRPEIF